MARKINYEDDELITNPFAFAEQAPVFTPVSAPVVQAAAPVVQAAAPVVQAAAPAALVAPPLAELGPSRRGDVQPAPTGQVFDQQAAIRRGIIEVPKPPEIVAEEKRIGREIVPFYQTGSIERGQGGASQQVEYGAPVGYRYDNGQSQYVNYDTSGVYQGTEKRQPAIDPATLAVLAMPFVGPALFEALGLTGGAAGGGGLLGETAVLGGAGDVAANLTPAAIESLLGTAGYGVNASALETALATGIPAATVGAGAAEQIAAANSWFNSAAGASGMGGGTGLTAALGTDLASGGALTAGGAGAAGMGGGAGLTAALGTDLAAGGLLTAAGAGAAGMGGGTGLTAAGAGLGTGGTGLLGETAVLGAGEGLTTGGAGASGMGGGTGLTATLGTDLAGGGALTAGDVGLASMGGGTGLTALSNIGASAGAPLTAAGTGLASMGGGTGLTTAAAGGGTVGAGGVTPAGGTLVGSQGVISSDLSGLTGTSAITGTSLSSLPSWATIPNALMAAGLISSIAKANETAPTAPTFTMAPYVPPSGKPFANIAMSPIATPYTPTRILGQYDPTMTPGGVSPYELIMAQMQAPKNLYADFEAGTNIGGFDPQRFVTPAAPSNFKGGMIDKSRMVGPNPMGPDNGFASIQDGEFVMNRKATQKYGIELMNAINSGKISKGKLSGLLEA